MRINRRGGSIMAGNGIWNKAFISLKWKRASPRLLSYFPRARSMSSCWACTPTFW